MSAVAIGKVMERMGLRSELLRDAAKLYVETFAKLDEGQAQVATTTMAFFASASNAYDAEGSENATDTMKILAPGAFAEQALEHFRSMQKILAARKLANDTKSTADYIQKIASWLEAKGWIILPRDLPHRDLKGRTAAGIRADMIDFAKGADEQRANMAAEIAAKKGAKR